MHVNILYMEGLRDRRPVNKNLLGDDSPQEMWLCLLAHYVGPLFLEDRACRRLKVTHLSRRYYVRAQFISGIILEFCIIQEEFCKK